ncbi:YciI family protein [Virgibacillus ndiopensis]|uniref:YciI family protein n=1 Tax=Virgibacillus ndiopensis TaxID=2004408 RepID=UPI000C0702ED|nr:YciI family protein [Virgibacillus ndiopensis]
MQKFVAILKGKKRGELNKILLIRHIEHLKKLNEEGNLFICGPFKDNDKAMQILLCETIEEAIKLVESDPFIKEGYYATYEVNELIEAKEENNWLMEIPQTKHNLTKH